MAAFKRLEQLDSGAFGEVWRCRREGSERDVAMKRLKRGTAGDDVARFAREVRLLAKMDHPNIVKVVAQRLQAPPYFYVMPLYKTSLRSALPSIEGNEQRIFDVFSRILDGMEYAHSQGVIHRDLKPENILMNSDADLVISDFGLGRLIDSDSTRKTVTGFGMGTRLYMAPEQFTNAKHADARADVYSLGLVLYELYAGDAPMSVIHDLNALPPGIAFIVRKCTAANPDDRFQSAGELKQAWSSLFAASTPAFEELSQLLATLDPEDSSGIDRLLEILMKCHEDADVMHEALMQLDPGVVVAMLARDPQTTQMLLNAFLDHNAAQSWPFDYTDKIGNRCRVLFDLTDDVELRASILLSALEVGKNHNRWHVLGIFGELVSRPKEPAEAMVLVDRLRNVHERTLRVGANNLPALSKLHPALRQFFAPFKTEEDED